MTQGRIDKGRAGAPGRLWPGRFIAANTRSILVHASVESENRRLRRCGAIVGGICIMLMLAGCSPLRTWYPTALHRDSRGDLLLVVYTCGYDLIWVDVGVEDDERSVYARIDTSLGRTAEPVEIPLDRLGPGFPVSPEAAAINTADFPMFFVLQRSEGTLGKQFFERGPVGDEYVYLFSESDGFESGTFENFAAASLEYCA